MHTIQKYDPSFSILHGNLPDFPRGRCELKKVKNEGKQFTETAQKSYRSVILNILVSHEHCLICIFRNGTKWLTSLQKENSIYYLKTISTLKNILPKSQNFYYDKIIKFRMGNQRLQIETGRWDDTPLSGRTCYVCNKTDIGNEYHYLFSCDIF